LPGERKRPTGTGTKNWDKKKGKDNPNLSMPGVGPGGARNVKKKKRGGDGKRKKCVNRGTPRVDAIHVNTKGKTGGRVVKYVPHPTKKGGKVG